MFLISAFQDLCELQNRRNRAPDIYIVLSKKNTPKKALKEFYSPNTEIHLFPNA